MILIDLYRKPACGMCDATERAFANAGVGYVERSALDHLDELRARGFASAPVVVVRDGEDEVMAWSGLRPDLIRKASGLWLAAAREAVAS